jgi:hypothetical protein
MWITVLCQSHSREITTSEKSNISCIGNHLAAHSAFRQKPQASLDSPATDAHISLEDTENNVFAETATNNKNK